MNTVDAVFNRYEEIRPRLPENQTRGASVSLESLLDISDQADAFVFDAFGVLNVGEHPIPGAAERLDQLRELGCKIRVLSNAASYDKAHSVRKFRALGMNLEPSEIITSRDAIFAHLDNRLWGIIAANDDSAEDFPTPTLRLGDSKTEYDRAEGFVFLSTADWNADRQRLLTDALTRSPRPLIIANADLVAPRGDHLSLEPGFYGHSFVDQGHADTRFFGKPYPDIYDHVSRTLPGIRPDRIVMCGDSPHTDILGAAAQGWKSVLVTRDGLFADVDVDKFCLESGIHANWKLRRI